MGDGTHPEIGGLQAVRALAGMRRDPLRTLTGIVWRHGDVVRMSFQGRSVFLLRGPEAVQHVLVRNQDNYTKDSHSLVLRSALGDGLLTAAPHVWATHRQVLQPHFAARRLPGYAPATTAAAAAELDAWKPGPIDFFSRMTELSVRVMGSTLFGVDFEPYKGRVARAISVISEEAGVVALSPISLVLPSLPGMNLQRAWKAQFRRRRRVGAAVAGISGLVDEIVSAPQVRAGDNLLGLLLRTYDDALFTAEEVRDEIVTFLIAGAETVAVTLTWMRHLLDRDPEIERARPARFADRSDRPRLAYLPFGAGRRMCIGAGLATMQTILIAAMTVQRFDARSAYPGRPLSVSPRTTLRPRSGLPIRLSTA